MSNESQAMVLIRDNDKAVRKLLPENTLPISRFANSVQLYFNTNASTLGNCTPQSKLESILFAAQLGLEPGYGNKIHFIAFGNKCTPIVGYNGFLELAERSGRTRGVVARLVHANDEFEIDYAQTPVFKHKPCLGADRGDIIGAYAVIYKAAGCGEDKFEWMPKADIDAIRARSKAAKAGPWVTDYGEMAKKTVIRRAFKTEIISPLIEKAIEIDNRVEDGKSYRDIIDLAPGDVKELDEPKKLSMGEMTAGTPSGRPRGKSPHTPKPEVAEPELQMGQPEPPSPRETLEHYIEDGLTTDDEIVDTVNKLRGAAGTKTLVTKLGDLTVDEIKTVIAEIHASRG